tara:strand:- start:15961 stop:16263 length:303 start_codon:yes stop_codon:yes gene_type:complete
MINVCRDLIRKYPFLADSDVDLIWYIWTKQLSDVGIEVASESAITLMRLWKSGEIASPFNISRSRRKCQEIYADTRGKTWIARHEQQEQIIEDLHSIEEE